METYLRTSPLSVPHQSVLRKSALPVLVGWGLLLACSQVQAVGGIALGATRIIYEQGAKQAALPVRNSNKDTTFLIQSWVDGEDGKKSADFVVTPPLFSLKPASENSVRIIFVGEGAPTDREQVYYFNSKAIPAVDKSTMGSNTLQIAVQSEIKIFLRPEGLSMKVTEAPALLRCQVQGDNLVVTNPSPYYVSLAGSTVGGEQIEGGMVEPKGSLSLPVKGARGEVKLRTINDFGALTEPLPCPAS